MTSSSEIDLTGRSGVEVVVGGGRTIRRARRTRRTLKIEILIVIDVACFINAKEFCMYIRPSFFYSLVYRSANFILGKLD